MKKAVFATIIGIVFSLTNMLSSGTSLAGESQIVFVSQLFQPGLEIVIINSDGTVPQNLKSPEFPRWPTWSPDGKKIAFVADVPSSLYLMDADGRNLVRFLPFPSTSRPAWSPDGLKIAFTTFQEIRTYDLKTEEQMKLFVHPNGLRDPAWSPGGRQIAFTIRRGLQTDIYVINAGGTQLRQLTKHSAEDHAPAWSPDGRQIAFFSSRDRKLASA